MTVRKSGVFFIVVTFLPHCDLEDFACRWVRISCACRFGDDVLSCLAIRDGEEDGFTYISAVWFNY